LISFNLSKTNVADETPREREMEKVPRECRKRAERDGERKGRGMTERLRQQR